MSDEWHLDLDLDNFKFKPRLIEKGSQNTIYQRKIIYEWFNEQTKMPFVLFDDMQFVILKQDPCFEIINMDLNAIS